MPLSYARRQGICQVKCQVLDRSSMSCYCVKPIQELWGWLRFKSCLTSSNPPKTCFVLHHATRPQLWRQMFWLILLNGNHNVLVSSRSSAPALLLQLPGISDCKETDQGADNSHMTANWFLWTVRVLYSLLQLTRSGNTRHSVTTGCTQ